jgi:hypothetical protein
MNDSLVIGGPSLREVTANSTFAIRAPKTFNVLALAGAIALGSFLGVSRACADATTQPDSVQQDNAELRGEVNQLKTKVDQLEANQPQSSSAGGQPAQAAPYVPNTNQSSFSAFRFTSGYDPAVGFVIRSDDGQFSLHPGLVLDFRNMTSYRESVAPNSGSEVPKAGYNTENGFDLTRARLTFDGRATDNVSYFVQFQDDQGTTFGLLDAYWAYHFGKDSPFALKVGQFKDPVWHERNLSEANLLAVDRSLTEFLLGGGQTSRVQGVDLMYDQDRLRAQLAFHDGFNSLNTKFFDSGGLGAGIGDGAGITPTNFGVSTREEFLLIGNRTPDYNPYTDYDRQFTALGDKQDLLVLGGGADFTQASSNDVLFHSADLQYDTACGFSAYGAYLASYRDIHANQGVVKGFYYDPGFVVQAAYLVTPKIEPFARYDYSYLPLGSTTGLVTGEVQEITVGANYYLYKQHVKFTLDASWLPNGAPSDSDALGILKDSGHGEYVVRAQFQLAI